MVKALRIPLLACIGFLLMGCADNRAWTSIDPWFRPPPENQPHASQPIDGSRIEIVMDSKEIEAEDALGNAPFVEITPAEAEKYVGLPLIPHPNAHIYLLRGVYLNRRTGVFDVVQLAHGDILVYHECLGIHPVPMRRQVLVVQLDQPPRQVFTLCRMVE